MSHLPTVILIHGACHGNPTYMDFLKSWLTYNEVPFVGTCCPSDACDPPTKGLVADAEYARGVITKEIDQGKDVVVFMHSYGGMVGTEAAQGLGKKQREAEGKKGGIVHLYYLCAFMLHEGKSTAMTAEETGLLSQSVTVTADGGTFFHDPSFHLYNDLVPEAQEYWATQLHTWTAQCLLDPITHASWKDIPSTYVQCEQDEAIPIKLQEYFVDSVRGDGLKTGGKDLRVERLKFAHSPFLNAPAVVAESVKRACLASMA